MIFLRCRGSLFLAPIQRLMHRLLYLNCCPLQLHSANPGRLVAGLAWYAAAAGGNSKDGEGSRDGEVVDTDILTSWESLVVDIHAVEDILVVQVVGQWPDCRDLVEATGLLAVDAADLEASPCSASIEPAA